VSGNDTARRRRPIRLSSYRNIHEQHMAQLRARGFVHSDDLEWLPGDPDTIELRGHVYCLGRILIRVYKELEIVSRDDPDPIIFTRVYEYNALVYRRGNILRYDNDHPVDDDPAHAHGYHCHVFPWPPDSTNTRGVVSAVEDGDWPTLAEFIYKVAAIYYEHVDDLGLEPANESMPVRRLGPRHA
jgi:hypothetical protein